MGVSWVTSRGVFSAVSFNSLKSCCTTMCGTISGGSTRLVFLRSEDADFIVYLSSFPLGVMV